LGLRREKNYRIATLEFLAKRKTQSRAALSRLRCPVRLVYGTEDVAYPQEYTEEFLENLEDAGVDVSLHIVPGAPHFVCTDYADEIDPVLHDFILQNDDRKPPPVSDILSPWDTLLRSGGWDPEGVLNDDSDDDFTVTYPPATR